MADPEEIKFKLTTEGDPSGAEVVEKSIVKAKDAAEDVGEAAQAADPQIARLINIERAKVASQLANAVGQIGGAVRALSADLKGTDKELAQTLENSAAALDSVTGALSGAAQGFAVGGPFGAAIGGLVGLMSGPLKSAYDDMIKSLDAAAKAEARAKKATEDLKTARALFAAQVRLERLDDIYDSQTEAIKRNITAIEQRAIAEKAQRDAAGATTAAFGPTQTPEQQIGTDLKQKIAEIESGVKKAADLAGESARLATEAIANAQLVTAAAGENSKEAIQAASERDAAVASAESARVNAENIAVQAEAEKVKVRTAAATALTGLSTEASGTISKLATDVRDRIQAEADRQGGQIGNDARGAMEQLTKLLQDNIPDETQFQAFQQALQQFRGSQDASIGGMVKTMDEILQYNREINAGNKTRDAAIAALRQEVINSNQRLGELASGLPR